MMNDIDSELVIVAGMHRSGTSLICRILGMQGYELGNNLLEGIENINDDGFWEDQEVMSINERLFELLSTSWFDIGCLFNDGKPALSVDAEYNTLLSVAEDWYREQHLGASRVAIKDPRFCRLLPFWGDVFKRLNLVPKILIAIRHPAEVVASIMRRDGFDECYCYLLWLYYMFDLLNFSSAYDRVVIDYDSLILSSEQTAETMLNHFGLAEDILQEEFLEAVGRVVDSRKKHNCAQVLPENEVVELSVRFYDLLMQSKTPTLTDELFCYEFSKLKERFFSLQNLLATGIGLALKGTQKNFVLCNQALSDLGESHQKALETIQQKDALLKDLGVKAERLEQAELAVLDRERKIEQNIDYITRCEQRISEQDKLLSELGLKAERLEQAELAVSDREEKLAENLAYIEKCQARIEELDSILLKRQQDLEHNSKYIEQCTGYIAELEQALEDRQKDIRQNTDYIALCEARIHELDEMIAEKQTDLDNAAEYIDKCHNRINELDEVESDLLSRIKVNNQRLQSVLKDHHEYVKKIRQENEFLSRDLNNLRSLRMVRLAEKLFNRNEA
ncbi:MAG: hypothetical protein KDI30_07050 [Pseudomonadales bacterium]|nr:hypothetical protein [Pseudomonadales bacterium]